MCAESGRRFKVDARIKENLDAAVRKGLQFDGGIAQHTELSRKSEVRLSNLPDILMYLGEPDVPLMMIVYNIRKVVKKHGISVEKLCECVAEMNRPVLVIREGDGTYLFLLDTETPDGDDKMSPIVGVVRKKGAREDARHAVSFYPLSEKKERKITGQFKRLVYCKYKRAAMSATDAPESMKATELLRAAVDGGYAETVASLNDLVKGKNTPVPNKLGA